MSLRGKTVDDPRDQRWIDIVAQYGHGVISVSDALDEPTDEPGFTYSFGAFESQGAPELIIFSLDNAASANIINDMMDDYAAGRRVTCGIAEYEVVGGRAPVVFLEVDPVKADEYARVANWYYEGQPFPLRQIVWPAKKWRLPMGAGLSGRDEGLAA